MRRSLPSLSLVVLALVAIGCGKAEPAAAPETTTTAPPATVPATAPATTPPKTIPVEPGSFLTATPKGKVQGFDAPDGTPTQEVDHLYYDVPTALPVIDQADEWVQVRLPEKPNGQTAWLKLADVEIGKTPWKVEINLTTSHLKAWKAGELVLDAPVGIGTDATPTVTGEFFITFLQAAPKPAYGPFVIITSGHSEVIQSWEGFPDGILGIHGPIGSEAAIAAGGGKMSNGCIRMLIKDQWKLADLQPGSPLSIVAA